MKILLIDHHELFGDGLRHVLQQAPGGLGELLVASDWESGLHCIGRHPDLDMVLLELQTPGCCGPDAIELLRKRYPHVPLVVVSSDEDFHVINKALSYGASGFVGKSSPATMLLGALNLVLAGSIYVPPQVFRFHSRPKEYHLTQRQKQVLECLAEGCSNKEISERLHLAEGTIKAHVAAVFQVLLVNNRIEAARIACQMGFGRQGGMGGAGQGAAA